MRERLELLVNLWTFGVPVVLIVWATLRLVPAAPARLRYAIAIAGFAAALVLPLVPRKLAPGRSSETRAIAVAVAEPLAVPVTWAWIGVAVLLVARDAAGHIRLSRTRRTMDAAPDHLKRELDWPAGVPLVMSDHDAPFTLGLIRPAVVLPSDLADRFPSEVLRRIAGHELSHARWRDPLVFALLRGIAAIFWVAPVWAILRWVRREREAAADAAALRGTSGEEETYVAALIRLSRRRSARELAPAMAASDLEYRARRILAPQRRSVLALLVLALGALLLTAAKPAHLDEGGLPIVVRARTVIVHRPPAVMKVIPHDNSVLTRDRN